MHSKRHRFSGGDLNCNGHPSVSPLSMSKIVDPLCIFSYSGNISGVRPQKPNVISRCRRLCCKSHFRMVTIFLHESLAFNIERLTREIVRSLHCPFWWMRFFTSSEHDTFVFRSAFSESVTRDSHGLWDSNLFFRKLFLYERASFYLLAPLQKKEFR